MYIERSGYICIYCTVHYTTICIW